MQSMKVVVHNTRIIDVLIINKTQNVKTKYSDTATPKSL